MNTGNAAFDLAEKRAEEEREAGIAAASLALKETGSIYCEDCPAEIEPARRAALPSAKRCVDCQTLFEGKVRKHR